MGLSNKSFNPLLPWSSQLLLHSLLLKCIMKLWVGIATICETLLSYCERHFFPRKPCLAIYHNKNALGDSSLSPSLLKMTQELPRRMCNDVCNLLISNALFIQFFPWSSSSSIWRSCGAWIQGPFVFPLISAKYKLHKFWLDAIAIYIFFSLVKDYKSFS